METLFRPVCILFSVHLLCHFIKTASHNSSSWHHSYLYIRINLIYSKMADQGIKYCNMILYLSPILFPHLSLERDLYRPFFRWAGERPPYTVRPGAIMVWGLFFSPSVKKLSTLQQIIFVYPNYWLSSQLIASEFGGSHSLWPMLFLPVPSCTYLLLCFCW